MQIVKYDIDKNVLTVGFKEDNFVVYSSVYYDKTKTKNQLLQLAYEKVKKTIDYEKTLTEHSITTDKTGEVFIPQPSKPTSIKLNINDNKEFTVEIKDQYGETIQAQYTVNTSLGKIEGNKIILPDVTTPTDVAINAVCGNLIDSKVITVSPKIEDNAINPILNTLDRINTLESENVDLLNKINILSENKETLNTMLNSVLAENNILREKLLTQDMVIEDLIFNIIPSLGGGM